MKVKEATQTINQWDKPIHLLLKISVKRLLPLFSCVFRTHIASIVPLQSTRKCGRHSAKSETHEMKHAWEALISTCNIGPLDPLLPQYMQKHTIKEFMKVAFPTSEQKSTSQSSHTVVLAVAEENALRYVPGYIPRALRHKLEHSSHPFKEEFIVFLTELCTDDDARDDSSYLAYTTEWMKSYLLFREMELEFRKREKLTFSRLWLMIF